MPERAVRARERYRLDIELVDGWTESPPPKSVIGRAGLAAAHILTKGLVKTTAYTMSTEQFPSSGPQARRLTISERSTGERVLVGTVEAGDDGQSIVALVHRSWKLDDAAAFLDNTRVALS